MFTASCTHKDHTQKKNMPPYQKGNIKFKLPQISIGTLKTEQRANLKHWIHSEGDVTTSWTHKDHTKKEICPRTKKGTGGSPIVRIFGTAENHPHYRKSAL